KTRWRLVAWRSARLPASSWKTSGAYPNTSAASWSKGVGSTARACRRNVIARSRQAKSRRDSSVSGLAVVGAGAVFALEVFVAERGLDDRQLRFELERHRCHVPNALGGHGDLDGLGDGLAPGKRRVAVDQHGGEVGGIETLLGEQLDDDVARLPLVGAAGDFGGGHLAGHRHVAKKVVGVGGAKDRDLAPGLSERGGMRAVRVDDAADLGKRDEEAAVRGRVGGGTQ